LIVGVPAEIKPDENRVGIVPGGVETMRQHGHEVLVQAGAGVGSGISDEEFSAAGAEICDQPESIYSRADLVVKVKEPLPSEFPLLRREQAVFTFFHFAADRELTQAAIDSGIVAIAYETIQSPSGKLPLLIPMSEVAGKMAVQEGAKYLEKPMMGRGILSAECRGSHRPTFSSSGAALLEHTLPGSRRVWGPTSRYSMSTLTGSGILPT